MKRQWLISIITRRKVRASNQISVIQVERGAKILLRLPFLVYKNLGQRISESFEEDELENRRELQNIQEEAYSSDFESDEENEKDCRPKTIKDIRKSVLSFGSSKSTC